MRFRPKTRRGIDIAIEALSRYCDADCVADQQAASALSVSAGQGGWFFDNQTGLMLFKDAANRVYGQSNNMSVAAQGPGFAADTYLTDSDVKIPSCSLQIRSWFRWVISCSKTGAGVATPIFNLRIGSARTTADTSRLTLTGPAQTAVIDQGVWFVYIINRSVGAAGVLQGTLSLNHNLAATGLANNASAIVETTGAGFDNTALGGLFAGLSLNAGASASWTVTQVRVEAGW
jgi:hypothetical protein